jgi:hypothetical protein
MARKTNRLFTIGYEQTPAKAVLDELEHAGVKLLVDVRAVAASRRPGFSKNQLAAGLDARGISYLHLRGLGTPKDGREAARSGKFDRLHKIYAAHLKTPQAREELDELSAHRRKRIPLLLSRDHKAHPFIHGTGLRPSHWQGPPRQSVDLLPMSSVYCVTHLAGLDPQSDLSLWER